MKRIHVLGALLALGCTHEAPPPATPAAATSAEWDTAAADEARATIERDMQSFGKLDVEVMRPMLASDGFVTTYDIDGMGQPVSFASADEALTFLGGLFEQMKKAGAQVQFTPSGPIDCRATSALAYCAFAADVQATMGGKTEAMAQRTTAVLRKGADGWKWAHWHASLARMPEAPAAPPPPPAPSWPMSYHDSGSLKWEAPPGAPPGLRVATISGDAAKGAFSAMVEFPKKLSIPRHYHSANSWGYLVKGDMTVTLADGRVLAAKPGSTFMLPAKAIHTTETKTGATLFQYSDGPEDIVFVDDKGNPSPPPGHK